MEAEEDYELINSPLERQVTVDGISVTILIYRGEHETEWLLEVEDHLGGSTVWDDRFPNDQEALDEALKAIEIDGIRSFTQTEDS